MREYIFPTSYQYKCDKSRLEIAFSYKNVNTIQLKRLQSAFCFLSRVLMIILPPLRSLCFTLTEEICQCHNRSIHINLNFNNMMMLPFHGTVCTKQGRTAVNNATQVMSILCILLSASRCLACYVTCDELTNHKKRDQFEDWRESSLARVTHLIELRQEPRKKWHN